MTAPSPSSPALPVDVSVVVPMKNEEANVTFLVEAIRLACAGLVDEGTGVEAILVDDGSTDGTALAVEALIPDRPWLRLIRHPASGGQSAAIHSGVHAARGRLICTLDGDGQNPPAEIPKLVRPLLSGDRPRLGLVAGQRVGRRDSLSKRAASAFANGLRGWLLRDGTRDTGCGLKGFRRDAFLGLPYFDHMHRYLPALFRASGWEIAHVDVAHAQRHAGRSNYTNIERAIAGAWDLLGVMWLIRRAKRVRPVEGPVEPQVRAGDADTAPVDGMADGATGGGTGPFGGAVETPIETPVAARAARREAGA